MSKLRDVSLTTGAGTPKPISAYGSADRPSKNAAPTMVPRDNGGLSTGVTSGNFNLDGMTALPNNSGPLGTQDVADEVGEAFGHPVTSIL
jgi:hypothetical protein